MTDFDFSALCCPGCLGELAWMKQDAFVLRTKGGNAHFTERSLQCLNCSAVIGSVAWFPWPGAEDVAELFCASAASVLAEAVDLSDINAIEDDHGL